MIAKGYKQTEVGIIPKDWGVYKLGDVGDVKMCKRIFSYQTAKKGDIPFYKIGTFGKEPDAYIDMELYKEFRRKHPFPKKGYLLISASGTIGRTVEYNGEDAYFQDSNIIWLDNDENIITNEYLKYTLEVIKYNTEGSTIKRLYNSIIKSSIFVIPPTLKEQEAIAKVLTDTDNLIQGLENVIAKKKAIKKGAMQQLLTPPNKGGKRLPNFSGEWIEKNIKDLSKTFTKQTGFDYSNYIKPALVQKKSNDAIPFIQNKDFQGIWVNYNTDYFIPKELAVNFPMIILDIPCLLISISGSIGKVGVFNNEQTAFIGGAVGVSKFKNPELLEWTMYYLMSETGQKRMLKDVKAGSHQNLILDDIRKINIPMPKEKAEREFITKTLSDMDKEIEALEVKKEKYIQLKKGLAQELLTGKTRLV